MASTRRSHAWCRFHQGTTDHPTASLNGLFDLVFEGELLQKRYLSGWEGCTKRNCHSSNLRRYGSSSNFKWMLKHPKKSKQRPSKQPTCIQENHKSRFIQPYDPHMPQKTRKKVQKIILSNHTPEQTNSENKCLFIRPWNALWLQPHLQNNRQTHLNPFEPVETHKNTS